MRVVDVDLGTVAVFESADGRLPLADVLADVQAAVRRISETRPRGRNRLVVASRYCPDSRRSLVSVRSECS
jgi:hypothetical protein